MPYAVRVPQTILFSTAIGLFQFPFPSLGQDCKESTTSGELVTHTFRYLICPSNYFPLTNASRVLRYKKNP